MRCFYKIMMYDRPGGEPRWVHCCDDTMSESLGLIDEVRTVSVRNVSSIERR